MLPSLSCHAFRDTAAIIYDALLPLAPPPLSIGCCRQRHAADAMRCCRYAIIVAFAATQPHAFAMITPAPLLSFDVTRHYYCYVAAAAFRRRLFFAFDVSP